MCSGKRVINGYSEYTFYNIRQMEINTTSRVKVIYLIQKCIIVIRSILRVVDQIYNTQ